MGDIIADAMEEVVSPKLTREVAAEGESSPRCDFGGIRSQWRARTDERPRIFTDHAALRRLPVWLQHGLS